MSVPNCSTGSEVQLVDAQGHALDIQPDGSINVNAEITATIGEIEVSNDAGNPLYVEVTNPTTSVEISNDVGNPIPVSGAVTISDGSGPVTVDGSVVVSGAVTVSDGGGSLTVDDGGLSITVDGPLTDAQLRAVPVPVSGTVAISNSSVEISNDVGSPVPISGTVTITDGSGPVTVDGSVSIGAALPAGTNNIGDVDVLTLPGGLTGRAEDAAAASGEVGVPILGVRNDTGAARTSADGDYGMVSLDDAGRVRVIAEIDSMVPLGYQQLPVAAVAVGLTVPVGARLALIQAETADVRWRDDVAPTATVGMRLENGSSFEYSGNLAAIQFIRRTGASAVLNISYYGN
jgi:hypothetical protein